MYVYVHVCVYVCVYVCVCMYTGDAEDKDGGDGGDVGDGGDGEDGGDGRKVVPSCPGIHFRVHWGGGGVYTYTQTHKNTGVPYVYIHT